MHPLYLPGEATSTPSPVRGPAGAPRPLPPFTHQAMLRADAPALEDAVEFCAMPPARFEERAPGQAVRSGADAHDPLARRERAAVRRSDFRAACRRPSFAEWVAVLTASAPRASYAATDPEVWSATAAEAAGHPAPMFFAFSGAPQGDQICARRFVERRPELSARSPSIACPADALSPPATARGPAHARGVAIAGSRRVETVSETRAQAIAGAHSRTGARPATGRHRARSPRGRAG